VKRFVSANFREYSIYPFFVLNQALICFVFVHGVFANHEVHSSFNFEHKVISTLAVSQLKAEFREGNFLRCLVDIEVYDLSRGPTIRNRPNPCSSEFFNNVTATKDGTRKVECIFATPDPSCLMIVGRNAHSS
jgi:hypothetical protein